MVKHAALGKKIKAKLYQNGVALEKGTEPSDSCHNQHQHLHSEDKGNFDFVIKTKVPTNAI